MVSRSRVRGRPVAIVGLMLALAALGPPGVGAQSLNGRLVSYVELEDFGIDDAASIVHGRVALVHDTAGPRLDVHFLRRTRTAAAPPTAGPQPIVARDSRDGADAERRLTALWVWNTSNVLASEAERSTLFQFVEQHEISRVFLQLPAAAGLAAVAGFVPFDGSALGPVVAELRARGALTYALDGDPDYALRQNHAGVLRTVARVVAHNGTVPPAQRFHGVRYDIEPYLLPGFQGPRRAEILDGYVRLVADVAEAARQGDLTFGVDIPFWLDEPDEVSGEPFLASLDGSRMLVLDHVMSRVDDVAIMAYRTTAHDDGGVLRHTQGELVRARDAGVGVFVAIETTKIFDEDLYTLRGAGRPGLPTLTAEPWIVLEQRLGGGARVWLAQGAAALAELAHATADAAQLTYWFAGVPVPLPGDALSFHSLGPERMTEVTGEVLAGLRGNPSFRGLAFHDYLGLRALLDPR